jgi:hypothetical protein
LDEVAQYAIRIFEHVAIPISHRLESVGRKQPVAYSVASLFRVVAAVYLDYEALLVTNKIENILLEWRLPPEFEAFQAPIAKQSPHCGFGIRSFCSHLPRIAPGARRHCAMMKSSH